MADRCIVWAGAAALLALAACQPVPQLPGGPVPDPASLATCGGAGLAALVGQPARVLATMKFAPGVRFIRPGDAVTEDFSLQRLNIEIDLKEVITGVHCG